MGKEKKKAKSFDLASLDISYDWLLAELLTPELIHQYMTTAGWTPREVIRDRRIYWTRPGFPQVIQSTNKTTDLWDFLIRVAKVTKASLFQILFEVMEDAVTFQIAGREVKGLLGPEVESPLPAEKEIEPAANPSGKAALAKQLAAQNYKRTAIAQMLGVSRQTVSKYLNGKPAQKRH